MTGPREVLLEMQWRDGTLDRAEIHYVHRGAPHDTRIVRGADVLAIERSFLVLRGRWGEKRIPLHRISRIEEEGRPRWVRAARTPGSA